MDHDIDCRAIFNQIEVDTLELLKQDLSTKLKENMVAVVNEKVDLIHQEIDKKGEEFIETVIAAFLLEESSIPWSKKKAEERKKRLTDINSLTNPVEKNFQKSMDSLLESLDGLIDKVSVIDLSSELFQNEKLNKLLAITTKGELNIKVDKNIRRRLASKGKNMDLSFKPTNSGSYSNDDPELFNLKGTSCYNYWVCNPEFTDEDFTVELEYKITTYENYFYLGIVNQQVVTTSNCMCSAVSGGWFIQPNGDFSNNGSRTNNTKLAAPQGTEHKAQFRVLLSSMELYIQVDEKEEQGPFKLNGSKFRFVSGSCNTCNGYIRIVRSSYC